MAVTIKGATTIRGNTTVGFSPASLFAAGEQGVWYDPSDFSTMFQDTAGTTPVTATGQSIARINDKSGRGNNATQSTAASRPTLQQDANGCYYLSFDGSNDFLNFSALNISNQTIFIGLQPSNIITAASSQQYILTSTSGDFTGLGFGATTGFLTNERISWLRSNSGNLYGSGQTSENFAVSPYVMTFLYATTPATSYRRNAVLKTLTNISSGANGPFNSTIFPTNYARLCATSTPDLFLACNLYGLIIRGALSTSDQITAAENYMNVKTKAY